MGLIISCVYDFLSTATFVRRFITVGQVTLMTYKLLNYNYPSERRLRHACQPLAGSISCIYNLIFNGKVAFSGL